MVKSTTKICTSCNIRKQKYDFSDRNEAKDGKRNQCKLCINNKKKKRNICGIYKITSPTERVYIGQSKDIKTRWSSYRTRECHSQYKLNKSFKKYGVNNHIFEIIEECSFDDLNYRERYWQDFYEVVSKGLNCILTNGEKTIYKESTNRKKIPSIISNRVIDIIDLETGIFLYSLKDASSHCGIPHSHLADMLKGKARNKSSLIKSDDYEEGLLPNNLFTPKLKRHIKSIKKGMEVIDYKTKEIIGNTTTASKILNINETTLRSYLNGVANNKTDLIYKKDFEKGLNPKELCDNILQSKKCKNYITGEVFNSIAEAAKSLKIDKLTLGLNINGKTKHNRYPIELI